MRFHRTLLLVLLAALVPAAGCDSRQPLHVGEQLAELRFTVGNWQSTQYNSWVYFEDNGYCSDTTNATPCLTDADCPAGTCMLPDSEPDDYCSNTLEPCLNDTDCPGGSCVDSRSWLWCETVLEGGGTPALGSGQSVPWPFAVDVLVIRDGTSTRQRLTSGAGFDGNIANYDNREATRTAPSSRPSRLCVRGGGIFCSGGGLQSSVTHFSSKRRFRFSAGDRTLSVRRDMMNEVATPLANIADGTKLGEGLCSAVPPEPTEVDGTDDACVFYPDKNGIDGDPGVCFQLGLNRGDTIIVEAGLGDQRPASLGPPPNDPTTPGKIRSEPGNVAVELRLGEVSTGAGLPVVPTPYRGSCSGETALCVSAAPGAPTLGYSFTVR